MLCCAFFRWFSRLVLSSEEDLVSQFEHSRLPSVWIEEFLAPWIRTFDRSQLSLFFEAMSLAFESVVSQLARNCDMEVASTLSTLYSLYLSLAEVDQSSSVSSPPPSSLNTSICEHVLRHLSVDSVSSSSDFRWFGIDGTCRSVENLFGRGIYEPYQSKSTLVKLALGTANDILRIGITCIPSSLSST